MVSCFRQEFALRLVVVSLSAVLAQACGSGTYYTILDPTTKLSDKDKDDNPLSFGMQPFSMEAPLLKQKGDKMVQVGATTGMSVHGAYAISDHIGLYLGASFLGRNIEIDDNSIMFVQRQTWDEGILIETDSSWVMGSMTGKAKLRQGHLEGGVVFFKAGKQDWHHELMLGAGTTRADTRHELYFEYQEAGSFFQFQESRTGQQVFAQYNLGYRNESGQVVWMNRLGRAWQAQKSFEPYLRLLNEDVQSPYDFYSTGIRIGSGKINWHIYAQYERIFPLESTLMRWRKNLFSVGVVIRPFSQFSPDKEAR